MFTMTNIFLQLYVVLALSMPFVILYLLWVQNGIKKRLEYLETLERRVKTPYFLSAEDEPPETAESISTTLNQKQTNDLNVPPPKPDTKPIQPPETPVWHPDETIVMTQRDSIVTKAFKWSGQNWFHVMAAISLALAGIFITQYAADLLSPATRIAIALIFGLLLITAGEILRRHFGDESKSITAWLPSTFSGAGIVTLFGTILSARFLYNMLGQESAFSCLTAVALMAIVMGLSYGPFMAIIGITGATMAPFIVGGLSGIPSLLHLYFGLIAMVGLSIHAVRCWRGFDILALSAPLSGSFIIMSGFGGEPVFIGLVFALALMGPISWSWSPMAWLPGPAPVLGKFIPGLKRQAKGIARLHSFFWYIAAILIPFAASLNGHDETFLFAAGLLTVMFFIASIWARDSEPAIDMAAAATAGLFILGFMVLPGLVDELQKPIWAISGIIIAASGISLIAVMRSIEENRLNRASPGSTDLSRVWAYFALAGVPLMLVVLEIVIKPTLIIGAPLWAGIAMALAACATFIAERANKYKADRLQISLAGLVALSMISLSLFATMQGVGLSIALAVVVFAAALLDSAFRLPSFSGFIQVGIAVLLYRLIIDPGLYQAFDAKWSEFLIMYFAPIVLLSASARYYRDMGEKQHPATLAQLQSVVYFLRALTLTLIIMRITEQDYFEVLKASHAWLGLIISGWLMAGWAVLHNAGLYNKNNAGLTGVSKLPQRLRYGWTIFMLLCTIMPFFLNLTFRNPLFDDKAYIFGIPFFSTLIPAYLLPGLIMLFMAYDLKWLHWIYRCLAMIIGWGLLFHYAWSSVAHAWRGSVLVTQPMADGELWSYTVLLLIIGVSGFILALYYRLFALRYIANAIIIAAICKVFLIDASGLDGLVRVGSFLVLGLCLAGLAWINRLVSRNNSGD